MTYLEGKCKICGGKAIASWDSDAIQESVDAWMPLLTCNPCYDSRVKRNESGSAIINACFRYLHSKDKGKIREETRQVLLSATRAYAEAIQEITRAPQIIWSAAFVDCLMLAPEKCSETLMKYRDEVRRSRRLQAA